MRGGRGGGGEKKEKQNVLRMSECRVYAKYKNSANIREITDINLENRSYTSKSGDYRHKSGGQEIRLEIWSLPDYLGELTAQHPHGPKIK